MYEELKLLLTMSPHRHIISKPIYLVPGSDIRSNEENVSGFIDKFHPFRTLWFIMVLQHIVKDLEAPIAASAAVLEPQVMDDDDDDDAEEMFDDAYDGSGK